MDKAKVEVEVCTCCYRASCLQGVKPCSAPIGTGATLANLEIMKGHKLEPLHYLQPFKCVHRAKSTNLQGESVCADCLEKIDVGTTQEQP